MKDIWRISSLSLTAALLLPMWGQLSLPWRQCSWTLFNFLSPRIPLSFLQVCFLSTQSSAPSAAILLWTILSFYQLISPVCLCPLKCNSCSRASLWNTDSPSSLYIRRIYCLSTFTILHVIEKDSIFSLINLGGALLFGCLLCFCLMC